MDDVFSVHVCLLHLQENYLLLSDEQGSLLLSEEESSLHLSVDKIVASPTSSLSSQDSIPPLPPPLQLPTMLKSPIVNDVLR